VQLVRQAQPASTQRAIALLAIGLLCHPAVAGAADVLVANGSAPPDPANVVGDAAYANDHLWVRNAGCPPQGPADPAADCPAPGASTAVAVIAGADMGRLTVCDSASIVMSGGAVGGGNFGTVFRVADSASARVIGGTVDGEYLGVTDSAHLTWDGGYIPGTIVLGGTASADIRGGSIGTWLDVAGSASVVLSGGSVVNSTFTSGSASLTVRGGSVGWALDALHSSVIVIEGSDFEVDGSPVPYGPLAATNGILEGMLASGEVFSTEFAQGQGAGLATGTIELAPPGAVPVPATATAGRVILAACLLGGWLVAGRRPRTQPG
jgi:hypothetical protein